MPTTSRRVAGCVREAKARLTGLTRTVFSAADIHSLTHKSLFKEDI